MLKPELEDRLSYAVTVLGECLDVDAYVQKWELSTEGRGLMQLNLEIALVNKEGE